MDTHSSEGTKSGKEPKWGKIRSCLGCGAAAISVLVALGLLARWMLKAPEISARLAQNLGCSEIAGRPVLDLDPILLPPWQEDIRTIDSIVDVPLMLGFENAYVHERWDYEERLASYFWYEHYDGEAGWLYEFVHSLLFGPNRSVVSVRINLYSDDIAAISDYEWVCSGERWDSAHPEPFVYGQQEDNAYCYSYIRKLYVEDQSLGACWPYHDYNWFVVVQKRNMVIEIEENTWTSRVLHLQEVVDRMGMVLRR